MRFRASAASTRTRKAAGLGFRLSFYGGRLRAADTLAPLLGVVAIGIVATQAVRLVERRLAGGRPA